MEILILAFGCGIPLYVLWAFFLHFTTPKKKAPEPGAPSLTTKTPAPLLRPPVTVAPTKRDEPEDFDAWLDSFSDDDADDIPPYMWWD